ncbi:MAG: sulfatase-like hydrolase/transferase [Proteobacteria bacterium]|nr:sulfatase-like hydrolase/transferase [Pseudomonadota bacterium]MBU1715971.1 sulfatase-like hydrolase/transferase [Pseudomonadota bacterium]
MKNKLILFMLMLAGLGGAFLLFGPDWLRSGPVLADLEAEIGLRFPGGENYLIKKNLLRKGNNTSFRSIEAADGGKLLRIEVIGGLSVEEAQRTIDERLHMIQSLFSNLPSPYPGAITNKVEVPAELLPRTRPIRVGGEERELYVLSSSSRYAYGAMSAEMAAFRGGLIFIYDSARRTLFRVDLFIPRAEFDEGGLAVFFQGVSLIGTDHKLLNGQTADSVKATKAEIDDQSDFLAASSSVLEGNSRRKPGYNLIIIAFEPLGADHVSAYGYDKKTTPALDAFADDSFLFEQAVSPSSWSLPVFISWFTSLYPSQHKVVNKYSKYTEKEQVLANLALLSPGAVTMAQVLKGAGYQTAAFTGGASLGGDFGFAAGFDQYFDQSSFGGFDLTMPKAIDWLGRKTVGKFFLFVQGYDVHGKFPLVRPDLNRFLDKPYGGSLTATEDEYWALRNKNLEEGDISLPAEDVRLLKAVYDAKIFAADRRFGAFIDKLRELHLLERSIIVVSSGSGNEYFQHGRLDHGFSLYEELLHVPLLIRVPGAKGKRIKELVRTIDLLPTVIDLLAIEPAPDLEQQMQGVSLTPLLAGEAMQLDAVAETDYLNRVFKRSIRTHDGWKLIVSLDSEKRELYDLNIDPAEKNDLSSKRPRRVYELEQLLFWTLKGDKGK